MTPTYAQVLATYPIRTSTRDMCASLTAVYS